MHAASAFYEIIMPLCGAPRLHARLLDITPRHDAGPWPAHFHVAAFHGRPISLSFTKTLAMPHTCCHFSPELHTIYIIASRACLMRKITTNKVDYISSSM